MSLADSTQGLKTTDQRDAMRWPHNGALPNAPDYQHLFNQGWNAQNAMTPDQVYQDFKLKSMYAPEEQQQAFNLYQQYAPQYAAQNLKTLNKR